ncbi:MAG: hypothetical protein HRT87_06585 [Legionellales bacterium]|nr:hypothetical protein [Legionellales bacterium]
MLSYKRIILVGLGLFCMGSFVCWAGEQITQGNVSGSDSPRKYVGKTMLDSGMDLVAMDESNAEEVVESKLRDDVLIKKYINKEAERVHVKGDIYKPGIVKHFTRDELFEAHLQNGFDLEQDKFPVPVTLMLKEAPQTILREIQQTQNWPISGVSSCYINGWASIEKLNASKDGIIDRVSVDIGSIVCKHDKLEFNYRGRGLISNGGHYDYGWYISKSSMVKADISGEVLGVDFKRGIKIENDKPRLHYGDKVLVKFKKRVDANMDKQEEK